MPVPTKHLKALHIQINLEAGLLLPLMLKGRLQHGRHFTFKSALDSSALTFVVASVQGAFVTEDKPFGCQGQWCQILIQDDLLQDMIEDLDHLAKAESQNVSARFFFIYSFFVTLLRALAGSYFLSNYSPNSRARTRWLSVVFISALAAKNVQLSSSSHVHHNTARRWFLNARATPVVNSNNVTWSFYTPLHTNQLSKHNLRTVALCADLVHAFVYTPSIIRRTNETSNTQQTGNKVTAFMIKEGNSFFLYSCVKVSYF